MLKVMRVALTVPSLRVEPCTATKSPTFRADALEDVGFVDGPDASVKVVDDEYTTVVVTLPRVCTVMSSPLSAVTLPATVGRAPRGGAPAGRWAEAVDDGVDVDDPVDAPATDAPSPRTAAMTPLATTVLRGLDQRHRAPGAGPGRTDVPLIVVVGRSGMVSSPGSSRRELPCHALCDAGLRAPCTNAGTEVRIGAGALDFWTVPERVVAAVGQ